MAMIDLNRFSIMRNEESFAGTAPPLKVKVRSRSSTRCRYKCCDVAETLPESHRYKRLLQRLRLLRLTLVGDTLVQLTFQAVTAVCSPIHDEIENDQDGLSEAHCPRRGLNVVSFTENRIAEV